MADIELYEGERLDEVNERLRLISKNDGLTFGTDAFLLASFIRRQGNARACELGAGTGIISLLLAARERVSEIVAIEAQGDFAELAERNVGLNGLLVSAVSLADNVESNLGVRRNIVETVVYDLCADKVSAINALCGVSLCSLCEVGNRYCDRL